MTAKTVAAGFPQISLITLSIKNGTVRDGAKNKKSADEGARGRA